MPLDPIVLIYKEAPGTKGGKMLISEIMVFRLQSYCLRSKLGFQFGSEDLSLTSQVLVQDSSSSPVLKSRESDLFLHSRTLCGDVDPIFLAFQHCLAATVKEYDCGYSILSLAAARI